MTTLEDALRKQLQLLSAPTSFALQLLIVANHTTDTPSVFEVPISVDFAAQLKAQCTDTAAEAVDAEWIAPPSRGPPGRASVDLRSRTSGSLAALDTQVRTTPPVPYDRSTEFGRKNVLVLRLLNDRGHDVARIYQGFSPEKALQQKRFIGWWTGERFESVVDAPLVIDRTLRLVVVDGQLLMRSAAAFESLFGPLPHLREEADETFAATLGKLNIVGGDELLASCRTDINMMRKLVSVKVKLEQPGYVKSIEMKPLVDFLEKNKHIEVEIDRSGPEPRLVHSTHPQRRWALLKLLDDDYLRSDLTNINYEANSKIEI